MHVNYVPEVHDHKLSMSYFNTTCHAMKQITHVHRQILSVKLGFFTWPPHVGLMQQSMLRCDDTRCKPQYQKHYSQCCAIVAGTCKTASHSTHADAKLDTSHVLILNCIQTSCSTSDYGPVTEKRFNGQNSHRHHTGFI